MHCSANVGPKGDAAILFGSRARQDDAVGDPDRRLIGDDETIWSDNGLCNLEDGCYAKLIDLNKEAEPVIWAALEKPGTIVENVPRRRARRWRTTMPHELDLTDKSITENTRFSYPLSANPNVMPNSQGPHPQTIVLLTADAFGVLPPIAVLDAKQVMYHFVSGFTAKLAGTEVGITEPQAAFSACFGAPFMAHKPSVYAKLLASKMEKHKARCILLNTGWSGGAVRHRQAHLDQGHARAAECGRCAATSTRQGEVRVAPVFNMKVPTSCPGVDPRSSTRATRGATRPPTTRGEQAARPVPQELRGQEVRRARHRAGHVSLSHPVSEHVQHYKNGLIQFGQGQTNAQAIEEFERALALKPTGSTRCTRWPPRRASSATRTSRWRPSSA
jgi:phosphoenolpyruvate carboxykinase (ATP)